MAACTQRAGTITPVKSSVVIGGGVGLWDGWLGMGEGGGAFAGGMGVGGIGVGLAGDKGVGDRGIGEEFTGDGFSLDGRLTRWGWQAASRNGARRKRAANRGMGRLLIF